MKSTCKKAVSLLLALAVLVAPMACAGAIVTPAQAAGGGIAGSSLPQIYITITDTSYTGGTLTKDMGYMDTTIEVVDPTDSSNYLLDAGSQIKVRGNSTAWGAKRPYNFKLSSKTNVLGMGKGKKWCLLANMFDKSLMRNKLMFDFTHDIGLDYVPDTKMVDVWFNGAYAGCYLLTEPVEANTNRVDIDVDNGDFLFERERDRYEDGVVYFNTPRYGLRFTAGDPEEYTDEQYAKLMSLLDQAEAAIATNDYETIARYLDIDSFVDFYIALEYFKNADADYSSTRFYFKDGILYAGPPWDFDLSCGNCSADYYDYNNLGTTGNSYENFYVSSALWYQYLLKNAQFIEKVRTRYIELQPQIVNLYQDNELGTNRIDRLLEECGASFAANWKVWSESSQDSSIERIPEATFAENVAYLRNWLRLRNEWMLNTIESKTPFIAPDDLVDGVYTFEAGQKLLTADSAALKADTAVYDGSQQFVIQKTDGYYAIRCRNTGKYLIPTGNRVALQASATPEQWRIVTGETGTYTIFSRENTDLCLTLSGDSIQLLAAEDADGQLWTAAPQNVLTDGVYKLASNINTNYVMNIEGNSTENCANVYIWSRSNNAADQFVFESLPGGYYTIRALHSNYYLNVSGASKSEGANIIQYDDTSAPTNQIWSVVPNTDGTYSMVSLLSGRYIDVSSGIAANGTNVQCWTGNGTDAQKWVAEMQKTVNDGVYQITADGQAISQTESGVGLTAASAENATKLVVQAASNGVYQLRFVSNDGYLATTGVPDSAVQQQASAQLWSIVPTRDGAYRLASFRNNLRLASDLSAQTGSGQSWTLSLASIGLDGVYTIGASGNTGYLLDIGSRSDSGVNLQISKPDAITDSQKWVLQSRGDSYYVLRSLYSGRLLTAASASGANGVAVRQETSGEAAPTLAQWQLIPNTDGTFSLISIATGLYLDLSNNGLTNGNRVQLWSHDSTAAAQKWSLNSRFASVGDGAYPIQKAGSALTAADGTVSMAVYTGGENQQFTMTHTGDGYYTVTTGGKYLDGTSDILTLAAAGSDGALWTLLPNSDETYTFVCKATGHSLDETLQMLSGTGTAEQKFQTGPHRHKYVGTVTPPTCTEDGYTTYVCAECGDSYTGDLVEALGHDTVVDPAVEPDCTHEGLSAGSHCQRCGTVLVAQEVLPIRHQPVTDAGREPTCTNYGLTEGSHCDICGQTLVPQEVIPGGHTITEAPAVPATCTTDGLTAGSHCQRCGLVFAGEEIIPALGHDWQDSVTVPPTCTEPGKTVTTCARCNEETVTVLEAAGHHVVADPAVPATCTADGLTEGSHCDRCNAVFAAQQAIPATGHRFIHTSHVDCTEVNDGYDEYTCQNCGVTYRDSIPAPGCPSSVFTDVDRSKWYHSSIDYMVTSGYMYGMEEHYFGLNETVTRGQLAAILYRAAGSPDVTGLANPFADVPDGKYYAKAICWAYANNVVAGISETAYAPESPVTREQIAAILYRYEGKPAVAEDYLYRFPDRDSITPYAVTAMNWAVKAGLISGNKLNDGTIVLQPQYNAARAQCASILYHYLTTYDSE